MSGNGISVLEALEISINRIIYNFAGNWDIIGDMDGKAVIQGLSDSRSEYLEEMWRPYNHIFTEICICLEGNFAMLAGDNIVNLEQGDVCVILPEVHHIEMSKKNVNYMAVWISINMNIVALHLSGKECSTGQFYTLGGCSLNSSIDYSNIIKSIISETAETNSFSSEVVKMNILQILVSIYREINNSSMPETGYRNWKELIVQQVVDYIKKNYFKAIKLIDVSQVVCISPNYLNSMFKSMTGHTIIRFAEEYKINEAKKLLKDTDMSISVIASELGYYDQYHFSKIFKKETGCSPTQYRKTY